MPVGATCIAPRLRESRSLVCNQRAAYVAVLRPSGRIADHARLRQSAWAWPGPADGALFKVFINLFHQLNGGRRWASGPPLQERQLAQHRRIPITSRSLMAQSNMTTWRIVLQVGDGKHPKARSRRRCRDWRYLHLRLQGAARAAALTLLRVLSSQSARVNVAPLSGL